MRIFIAIPIPERIKKYADSVARSINEASPDIKWVEYENYHITLKFLGEMDEEMLLLVKRRLAGVAQSCPSFSFELCGTGFFPNLTRPKVLWMGVGGDLDRAAFLGDRIDSCLKELGFEPEKKRSFHLTLGRIRSELNYNQLIAKTAVINRDIKPNKFVVSEFYLMESYISPQGARYTVNSRYKLQSAD